ncbi:MAG TPA: YeeE/YedE thiosulfate transporter family protein [Methanoregulaceae archaeon]|nr:YeeE/YedE thiosulfate transporter family protein [Methanoregulaceae archaeon]HPD75665.1 YeeE/YedE thiosulfate transporter family protein [Methanoregulaceae archaeon]HRY76020.1 YeeE/YedE thiosulfate transporter family protein [Methanoregulaceae archaeon]
MDNENKPSGIDSLARNPLVVGLLIGILAALVQVLLISAGGPEAYGFCVACHTRDVVNIGVNALTGMKLAAAPISQNAVLPVMTVVGVLIGAFISAKTYDEFRAKTGSALSYLWYLLGGLFFMVFALFMGGCPYRIALRVGYGDAIAFIGLLGIIAGVLVGIRIATTIAEREV